MNRACLAGRRRRPRHIALDREVDLERGRAVTEPTVRTGNAIRKPIAQDVGRDRRRHVEHQHVTRRQVVGRGHVYPSLDLAAVTFDVSRQCLGDRLRAAFRHHPASGVPRHDQHQPDGAGHREVESRERVRCHAGPERLGLLRPPHATQGGRRQHRAGAEARQRQRMARHSQDGLRDIGEQVVEARRHRLEQSAPTLTVAPEVFRGQFERSTHHARRTVVERMGTVHRRLRPPEPRVAEAQPGEEG